jgi:hypothetical protein
MSRPSLSGKALSQRVRVGAASKAELLSRLVEAQVRLNPMAEQLLADPRFTTAAQVTFVQVVTVTVESLGLVNGVTFAQLAAEASNRGLWLCPLELAPCLRLRFTEQAEGRVDQPETQHKAPPGSVTVASAPPRDKLKGPWGFYLRRIDGGRWLRGYRSWSAHLGSPGDLVAFMRAQNAV